MMEQKNNKILLVSGSGFLGSTLLKKLPEMGFEITSTGRRGSDNSILLDLEKPVVPQIADKLWNENHSYGLVCAAMTDVGKCFENPQRSYRINVEAINELLDLFREFGIRPVFFSSDLVFDNKGGLYREEDPPNPTTLYGTQKLEIEHKIRNSFDNHLIFRTSKLMSMDLNPRSILAGLIESIREGREIKAFQDQYISPVFVEDVARAVGRLMRSALRGTYHLASAETINRYELAQLVCRELGVEPKNLRAISLRDFQFDEPRGPNHTLCSQKIIAEVGFKFIGIEEGIRKILAGEQC